jgi:hypothetical protein
LLRQDTDGFYFINVLTPPLSKWSPLSTDPAAVGDTKHFLSSIRGLLESRLRESRHDLRHLAKIRWLVHYFNLAAEEHGLDSIREHIEGMDQATENSPE